MARGVGKYSVMYDYAAHCGPLTLSGRHVLPSLGQPENLPHSPNTFQMLQGPGTVLSLVGIH